MSIFSSKKSNTELTDTILVLLRITQEKGLSDATKIAAEEKMKELINKLS